MFIKIIFICLITKGFLSIEQICNINRNKYYINYDNDLSEYNRTRTTIRGNIKDLTDHKIYIDYCISNFSDYLIHMIDFNLNHKFYLDKSIANFEKFTKIPNIHLFDKEIYSIIRIKFDYVKGFLINQTNLFYILKEKYSYYSILITIFNSQFLTLGDCIYDDLPGQFNTVDTITFAYTVKYSLNTCPLLFKNSNLTKIIFYGLSYNFVKKNLINFSSFNKSINSSINEIEMFFYKADLTKSLINEFVFEKVKNIYINGLIDKVDLNLFENLNSLFFVYLKVENLRYFLVNNIQCFNSINKDLNVNLSNQSDIDLHINRVTFLYFDIIYFHLNVFYLPNEDFCFFKNFPSNQLVYLVFSNNDFEFNNCSCTIIWILKDIYKLYSFFDFSLNPNYPFQNYFEPCGLKENFTRLIEECNFDLRLKLCNNTLLNLNKFKKVSTELEYLYVFEILKFFIIIFNPIICFFGLISNLINIKILNDRKNILNKNNPKSKKNQMYAFMFYNSCFNSAFLLIRFIHLINFCVSQNGVFCSTISRDFISQIIDIYLVNLIGNYLKIFSNLTSVGISLNRYQLLNTDFEKMIRKFKEKKIFKILIVIIFIILLVFFGWEKVIINNINLDYRALNELSDYVEFPDKNSFSNDFLDRSFLKQDIANMIYIFYILNFLLNDILFLLLFFISEILILVKAKVNFNKKISNNNLLNPNDKSKNLKAEKSNKQLTTVIILNSSINLFFKCIDFSISTFIISKRFTSHTRVSNICFDYNTICTTLEELSELFFSLSISYYTITYYYLNSSFNMIFLSQFIKIKKIFYLKI